MKKMWLCFILLFLVNASTSYAESDLPIAKNSSVRKVGEFSYGSGNEQIGLIPDGTEGKIGTSATSFFVKDGLFYILDNANKKIVITNFKDTRQTIPLAQNSWYEDLFVDREQNIYVLDTANRVVHKLTSEGKHINTYKIPSSIDVPTGVIANRNNEVIVQQGQDLFVNLETGKSLQSSQPLDELNASVSVKRINSKRGEVMIVRGPKRHVISFPFKQSFGGLRFNAVRPNQLIVTKTEVADKIPKIIAETNVVVTDLAGKTLGAVRIPLEKMYMAPRQLIRVDQGKIYLLSPEKEKVVIYELKPGKTFQTFLKKRIDQFKLEHKTGMKQVKMRHNHAISTVLMPNEQITRSEVMSRADTMIHHKWTVLEGNKKQATDSVLPPYVANASIGSVVEGLPYKWGGADGVDVGANGRDPFPLYQANKQYQTGDIELIGVGIERITGIDCSGFTQLSWFRTDKKYSTRSLLEIADSINKSQLKKMDALNSAGYHVLLYNGENSEGIYAKESTTTGGGKTQNSIYPWYYLEVQHNFVPMRYKQIVDDGQ